MKLTLIIIIALAVGWFLNELARRIDARGEWQDPARWALAGIVEIAVLIWLPFPLF